MSLRHGHESSLRLVSDFHRNLREQQNVCIAYSLRLRDVKAKLKVKKPVVIQEFLRTAASRSIPHKLVYRFSTLKSKEVVFSGVLDQQRALTSLLRTERHHPHAPVTRKSGTQGHSESDDFEEIGL